MSLKRCLNTHKLPSYCCCTSRWCRLCSLSRLCVSRSHAWMLPTPTSSSSSSRSHIINRQELPTLRFSYVSPCLEQLDAAWHINQHLSLSQTRAEKFEKSYDCEKSARRRSETPFEVLSASIDANDNRNDSLITTFSSLAFPRFFSFLVMTDERESQLRSMLGDVVLANITAQ